MDLNTCPETEWRLAQVRGEVRGWVQSRSLGDWHCLMNKWVRPNRTFGTITTDLLGGQCCYPAVKISDAGEANNRHVNIPLDIIPRYDLFTSFDTFQRHWQDGSWPYALYTSFGCIYGCSFCSERLGRWVPRSYAALRGEVERAVEHHGVTFLTPIDPLFNPPHCADHPMHVASTFRDFGVQWACTNGLRADNMNLRLAEHMSRSGCTTVGFGVETSDDELLKRTHKGETWADIERGLKVAKDHFSSVSAFVILGLPGSDEGKDRATIEKLLDLGVYVHLSEYVPGGHDLEADAVFYGGESENPLMREYRGLAWGSARDVSANVRGRLRLLARGHFRQAGKLLAMDYRKWRARRAR